MNAKAAASSAAAPSRDARTARGRIRVVHCLDSFDVGGTELNAVRTLERLDRDRFELRVAAMSTRGPLAERVRQAGIPIDEFNIGSLVGWGALKGGVRLTSYLRRHRVDVVHAHDIYSNIFAVPWARFAGVRGVIASRRWWSALQGARHQRMNRAAYRAAHVVLANSPSVGTYLEHEERVPRRKVAIVSNFVDEAAFAAPSADWKAAARAELGIAPSDRVIGAVANLSSVKDHATLLRAAAIAAAEVPGLRVVLVGEGAERPKLLALAEELGIAERVVLAGRRPPVPSYHWLFDVSMLTSLEEGFPNSIVEAMAAGRPVVATRTGGIPDAVEHGKTGLLLPVGDAAGLGTALLRLLRDDSAAQHMGVEGQRFAREHYMASVVIERLQTLYDRLATGRYDGEL